MKTSQRLRIWLTIAAAATLAPLIVSQSQLARAKQLLQPFAMPQVFAASAEAASSAQSATSNTPSSSDQAQAALHTATPQPTALAAKATPRATPVPTPTPKSTYDTQLDKLNQLGADYGITVSIDPGKTSITAATWDLVNNSDVRQLTTFTNQLTTEWRKYPVSFVQATRIKNIFIVKNMIVEGQHRSGMPDPYIDEAVYFDISQSFVGQDQYMRNVIHHEFGHLFENNFFGSYAWNDKAWKACNPAGFSYGSGGAAAYSDPVYANTVHPKDGFITGYATSGLEEDKAEFFARLMTSFDKVNSLGDSDANLRCKMNLYEGYLLQLSPEMTHEYLNARS